MKIFIYKNEYLNVTKHTGKMDGIPSISTCKALNNNCKALAKVDGSICQKCYVDRFTKLYKDLEPSLIHNTNILTNRLLTENEIKKLYYFNNIKYVRFEAFGDLTNEVQLINYINIAKAYKTTQFALWTKHYSIVLNYFRKGLKMPNNMNLVLSSIYIDNPIQEVLAEKIKSYHKQTITFTVIEDKHNLAINCGTKKCLDCQNCYKKGAKKDVIELLK